MAIEALAAAAVKEVGALAAKQAALEAGREIAQKMATEAGAQSAGRELQTAIMERQTTQEGFRVGEMPETKGEGREMLRQRESDAADELRSKLDAEDVRPEAAEQEDGQEAFRNAIKKETGWSDEIVDSIRNEGEYGVYKSADLKEGTVNGRQCLQREIDPTFKDEFGMTNMERMQNGKAPYDAESGDKIELHHMGQKFDSPFAELRENVDHGDGNHRVLHEFKTGSWRNESGSEQAYRYQREEYWKTRAQQLAA